MKDRIMQLLLFAAMTAMVGGIAQPLTAAVRLAPVSDGVCRELNSGRMWQVVSSKKLRSLDQAQAYVEQLDLGGYDDWRLPSVKELTSIIDFAEVAPAINETHFSHTSSNTGTYYWTATEHPEDSSKYFNIEFRYGTINALNSAAKANFVKCVRGAEAPYSLADNGDGSVTDRITGLLWEQGDAGPMNWEGALAVP